jgi:hypothetical protein
METSLVRKRVREAIDRSKLAAAERRTRGDRATGEYEHFLEGTAIPLFRQIANVLRVEGYAFTVFTPAGSVRLMSDRSAEDYIELQLDTRGAEPRVLGHTSRAWGRSVVESETPIGDAGPIHDLSEENLLEFVLKEIEAFVER